MKDHDITSIFIFIINYKLEWICVFVIILPWNLQSLKGRIDWVSLLLQYRASLAAGACSLTSPLADIRGRRVETLWQLQPSNRKGCANSPWQSALNLIFSKEAEQRLWHQIFSSSKRTMWSHGLTTEWVKGIKTKKNNPNMSKLIPAIVILCRIWR